MNADDLRAALQQDSLSADVSPDAAAQLPGRVRRRVRRRRSAQAGGLGLAALLVVGVAVSVGGSSDRRSGVSLAPVPSRSPVVPADSGLAIVLRPGGLWVNGPSGLTPVPGTKAATTLGQSTDGAYVSWMHTGTDGTAHGFVRRMSDGRTSDLGAVNDITWDTDLGVEGLAVSTEQGVETAVVRADGSWPLKAVSSKAAYSLLWDPTAARVVAQTRGPMQLITLHDADLSGVSVTPVPHSPDDAIPAAWGGSPESSVLLAWPDPMGSSSIAADGLELWEYSLDGAVHRKLLDSQLPYKDWLVGSLRLLAIAGGDRQAAVGKQLVSVRDPGDAGPPALLQDAAVETLAGQRPISMALSTDGTALAVVAAGAAGPLPTQGTVTIVRMSGAATTVPGLTDARAVERAPGGWLVIGISELHEVYDDGTVKDLGPVDGQSGDYYGHVPPTWVVIPTLD